MVIGGNISQGKQENQVKEEWKFLEKKLELWYTQKISCIERHTIIIQTTQDLPLYGQINYTFLPFKESMVMYA